MKKIALALVAACAAAFVVFQVGASVRPGTARHQPGRSGAGQERFQRHLRRLPWRRCRRRRPRAIADRQCSSAHAGCGGNRHHHPHRPARHAAFPESAAGRTDAHGGLDSFDEYFRPSGRAAGTGRGGRGLFLRRGRLFAAATWCAAAAPRTGPTFPPSRRVPPGTRWRRWLDNPTSLMGTKSLPICPGWAFCADFQWAMQDVVLKNGEKLRGFARRQTEHEVALQTLDGKFRMLSRGPDRQHHAGEDSPTCRSSMAMPRPAPRSAGLSGHAGRHQSRAAAGRCAAGDRRPKSMP